MFEEVGQGTPRDSLVIALPDSKLQNMEESTAISRYIGIAH